MSKIRSQFQLLGNPNGQTSCMIESLKQMIHLKPKNKKFLWLKSVGNLWLYK